MADVQGRQPGQFLDRTARSADRELSSVKGAIQVLQAPPTPGPAVAAPVITPALTSALTFILLLGGLAAVASSKSRRFKLLQTRR